MFVKQMFRMTIGGFSGRLCRNVKVDKNFIRESDKGKWGQ